MIFRWSENNIYTNWRDLKRRRRPSSVNCRTLSLWIESLRSSLSRIKGRVTNRLHNMAACAPGAGTYNMNE